jgi:hypothetical protein
VTVLSFPGGLAVIDPEQVWVALKGWLKADPTRLCSVRADAKGYACRLTWDAEEPSLGRVITQSVAARSSLGITDAVANALQAAGA